jgi:hypothetical protein
MIDLSGRSNSARFVGDLVVPRGWKVLVVLRAYIDGSNLHKGDDLTVCVAGCAATKDAWETWDDKWQELLDFSDIGDKWHHTEFMAKIYKKNGKTYLWEEARWLIARRMLCEAFEAIKPFAFGHAIRTHDYQSALAEYPKKLPEDPYYYLLDRCLCRVIQGLLETPKDEGVAVYCDQDKDRKLTLELAQWHSDYLRANEFVRPEARNRSVVTSYGSCVEFKPLQAADVIAHESMSYFRLNDPPFIPTNQSTSSWILNRLKSAFPFMAQLVSLEQVRAEIQGNFYEGFWPGFHYGKPDS